jgi:predicted SprT family Zn-dependent metalloprotease
MADRTRMSAQHAHGVRRKYKCVVCGAHMRLKRRQSHPTRGAAYELQTYACQVCGNTLQVNEPTPDAV